MQDPDTQSSRAPVVECVHCGETKAHNVSISIREGTTRDDVRGENEKLVSVRVPECVHRL